MMALPSKERSKATAMTRTREWKEAVVRAEEKVQQGIADDSIFLPGYNKHGKIGRDNPRFIEDNDSPEEEE